MSNVIRDRVHSRIKKGQRTPSYVKGTLGSERAPSYKFDACYNDLFIYLTHDGPPTLMKGVRRFERRIKDAP